MQLLLEVVQDIHHNVLAQLRLAKDQVIVINNNILLLLDKILVIVINN